MGKGEQHRMRDSKMYKRWSNIKSRCFNKNTPGYHNYGARDITMCDEWSNSFTSFYNHVKSLPDYGKKGYTLDRINNDGNYEPGNVRWVDKHIQVVNRRKPHNKHAPFVGVTKYPAGDGYLSYLSINRKRKHIASTRTILEAVDARNNYIIENGLWEYPIQATPDYLMT